MVENHKANIDNFPFSFIIESMGDDNQYSFKPVVENSFVTAGEKPLAGRFKRFGATVLDFLFLAVAYLPFLPLFFLGYMSVHPRENLPAPTSPFLLPMAVLGLVAMGALLVIQIVFLVKSGQTIGKKLLKIQIVNVGTGDKASFGRIFFLRILILGLCVAIMEAVLRTSLPLLGTILVYGLWIVDFVFIFRKDRRTLHDLIANTKVIDIVAVHAAP